MSDETSTMSIDEVGNEVWNNAVGEHHREDGPAFIYTNGSYEWWRNGQIHRDGAPAVGHPDGTKEWYKDGRRHREDGPARELAGGTMVWYRNDKKHREDGPAIERPDGSKEWWLNGEEWPEGEKICRLRDEERRLLQARQHAEELARAVAEATCAQAPVRPMPRVIFRARQAPAA